MESYFSLELDELLALLHRLEVINYDQYTAFALSMPYAKKLDLLINPMDI